MGYFCLAFQVMCIDGLGKGVEASESVWLMVEDHVILDVFCKTVVSLLIECCIAPLDSCG